MTQEEKELLLRDISARLPYGVKVFIQDITEKYSLITEKVLDTNVLKFVSNKNILIKPYLRPLSSMTKEEDKEYAKVIVKSQYCSFENSESATTMVNDWLLSKGFDVRGLISKDLAIEAPEGMYK